MQSHLIFDYNLQKILQSDFVAHFLQSFLFLFVYMASLRRSLLSNKFLLEDKSY